MTKTLLTADMIRAAYNGDLVDKMISINSRNPITVKVGPDAPTIFRQTRELYNAADIGGLHLYHF